jgi:hypothetical protein
MRVKESKGEPGSVRLDFTTSMAGLGGRIAFLGFTPMMATATFAMVREAYRKGKTS